MILSEAKQGYEILKAHQISDDQIIKILEISYKLTEVI